MDSMLRINSEYCCLISWLRSEFFYDDILEYLLSFFFNPTFIIIMKKPLFKSFLNKLKFKAAHFKNKVGDGIKKIASKGK